MIPVVLASQVLKILLQERSHLDDTVGHALDLTQPLLVQFRVAKDLACDACTIDGRVGVKWADEDLDLRVDAFLLLGAVCHDAKGTNSLAVKTHVLGKRLGERKAMTLLDEKANGIGVTVGVTAGEALVCHIEEWVVALLLEHIADLLPLLLRWVDTSGVVGAGV
jgi:hypothetical protein